MSCSSTRHSLTLYSNNKLRFPISVILLLPLSKLVSVDSWVFLQAERACNSVDLVWGKFVYFPIGDLVSGALNRFVYKTHTIPTTLNPYEAHSHQERMLYGAFSLLKDFYENEKDLYDWKMNKNFEWVRSELDQLYKWWTITRPSRECVEQDNDDTDLYSIRHLHQNIEDHIYITRLQRIGCFLWSFDVL